jgi:hypothetical protein
VSEGPNRPDLATLADWVEGRLPAEQADRVAAAVALGDPRLRATVAWLLRFHSAADALLLFEPPPIVRQNLRRAFEEWSATGTVPDLAPVSVPVLLSFDSRRDLAAGGVRAAGLAEDTVHLVFTGEVADVVVDIRRAGAGLVDLNGQVLPVDSDTPPVFAAALTGPGFAARTVDGDELGRFRLTGVPHRVLELRVTNGDTELVATVDLAGAL